MKKILKKRLIIAAALVAVAALAGYSYSAWRQAAVKNTAGTGYTLNAVSRGDLQVLVEGNGAISPGDTATVKAKVNGTVASLLVDEGQQVTKGDTILLLDSGNGQEEIQLAQITLDIEKRNLNDLLQDRANLQVTAPAAGVVGSLNVEAGDMVQAHTTLTTITDKSRMEASCLLNKAQAALVKKGDPATILLNDLMQSVSGQVSKVGTSATAGSDGSFFYSMEIIMDNPGGLYEGMTAQITIHTAKGDVSSPQTAALSYPQSGTAQAQVGGTVTRLTVAAGDTVKKGQVIATLASPDLETQIIKQQLTVEQKALLLRQAIDDLAGNNITAPISGTVMSLEVTEGDELSPSTAIATISDYDALQVVIPVDELDIGKVRLGQEATVTGEAVPDREYRAVVSDIAEEGVSASGVATFDVTLTLLDREGLLAGMTVDASIFIQSKKGVLLIPVEALQQAGGKSFVLVAAGGSTDPAAARRVEIETGLSTADLVEVTSGLAEGDQVLVAVTTGDAGNNGTMMPLGGGTGGPPPGVGQGGDRNGGGGNGN